VTDNIGGATYQLEIDDSRFTASALRAEGVKQQLVNNFKQVDAASAGASRGIGGFDSTIHGLGRTSLAVALGMGGLNIAVTGLHAALKNTIAAAAEDAASQARLQAAVAASGASYAAYATQLDAVIKKGQERGFTDDQTRSGLAILIAQTDSVGEATKRYAIAQDLARGAGIDVVTASRLLGKITEENVTALQRYGITVKAGATETEALAAVQRKFAGQAQAFADSPAGQFARTTDSIREAGESLGRVLLPAVVQVSSEIAAGAGHLEDFTGKLEGAGNVAGDLFPSLTTGAVAFGIALGAIRISEFALGVERAVAARIALARLAPFETFGSGSTGQLPVRVATGGGIGAVFAGINPATAAVAAATVAVVGLDLAARHFTGGGIVDYLTGETQAHKRAAAAIRDQGDAVADLKRLTDLGVSSASANALELQKISENIAKAQATANARLAEAQTKLSAVSRDERVRGASIIAGGQRDFMNTQLDQAAKNVRDLHLSYADLSAFAARNPLLGSRLDTDLKLAYADLVLVKGQIGATADVLRTARTEFDKGLQLATGELNRPNPVAEQLKVQLLGLEQLKRTAQEVGDTEGVQKLDAQIASLNSTIADIEAPTKLAQQAVIAWGASAETAAGADATAINAAKDATARLADAITTLPPEATIKLSLLDPEHIRDLITAMAAGLSFEVAVKLVSGTPSQVQENLAGAWTGTTPGSAAAKAVEGIATTPGDAWNRWMAEAKRQADNAAGAAHNFASGAAAAGGAAAKAEDPLLALAAAFDAFHAQTGGTPADFRVALRLGQDRLDLDQRLADVQTALNVSTMEAGNAGYQLQLTYAAIAEEAVRSGSTVEQVTARMFEGILGQAKSALDGILNAPTRESTQMQLQIDLLQRQADLLTRGGAKTTAGKGETLTAQDRQLIAVQAQIKALELEQKIRQDDLAIMRDQAVLADKTLRTDRDLAAADVWLTGVVGNLSGTVMALDKAMGGLLGTLAGGIGHAALGGLHSGLTLLGERGPELANLGSGSMVMPADVTRLMLNPGIVMPEFKMPSFTSREGGGSPVTIQQHFTINADMADAAINNLVRKVEQANERSLLRAMRGGSLAPTGSNR
jgi:hypothetical protein